MKEVMITPASKLAGDPDALTRSLRFRCKRFSLQVPGEVTLYLAVKVSAVLLLLSHC